MIVDTIVPLMGVAFECGNSFRFLTSDPIFIDVLYRWLLGDIPFDAVLEVVPAEYSEGDIETLMQAGASCSLGV